QQKDALSTGVRQIISTTPSSIDCFEFQFSRHRVYTYRLGQTHVLLVLAQSDLEYAKYFPVFSSLKSELLDDLQNAIANLRLAVSNTTLQKHPATSTHPTVIQEQATPTQTAASHASSPPSSPAKPRPGQEEHPYTQEHGFKEEPEIATAASSVYEEAVSSHSTHSPSPAKETSELTTPIEKNGHTINTVDTADTADTAEAAQSLSLKDVLSALNQFSRIAARYLGATIVSNYWKSSRPAIEWLSAFEIDRKGQITFTKSLPNGENQVLTPDQHEWLSEWLTEFIQRCSSVIRNFPSVVQKMELSPTQRSLLLPGTP
ncbi:MAG: hypothetical protein VKL39_18155, partial [Leptolyngbyaceae bacterium]|nr:hypothetical protein [Leptolyngbyaceae bacterium]